MLFAVFFGNKIELLRTDDYFKYQSETGVQYVAKTQDKQFYVYEAGTEWRELYVAGVNIGAAKPGSFPGD